VLTTWDAQVVRDRNKVGNRCTTLFWDNFAVIAKETLLTTQ